MNQELTKCVVLGAGPVGRAIVASLEENGLRPTVVTRSGTAVEGADALALDIHDVTTACSALADTTHVFHAAQPEYHRWVEDFPPLQHAVVNVCQRLGAKLIAVENLYGYGLADGAMRESTPFRPNSKKGAVRADMAAELVAAHDEGRIEMFTVRASDFFGPAVDGSAFGTRFFDAIKAGKKAEVMGDPFALHTVTFVPDIGHTMVTLADRRDAYGHAWHVPSPPALSQADFAALAADVAGTDAGVRRLKRWQLRLIGLFMKPVAETIEMLYEFEHDFVMDDTEARTRFGLTHTPLRQALAETMGLTPAVVANHRH